MIALFILARPNASLARPDASLAKPDAIYRIKPPPRPRLGMCRMSAHLLHEMVKVGLNLWFYYQLDQFHHFLVEECHHPADVKPLIGDSNRIYCMHAYVSIKDMLLLSVPAKCT